MRTTLDISEDVLYAVKALGKREHKSAGQVLSELARRALQSQGSVTSEQLEFLGFRPLAPRGVVISSELIEQLRDEEGL